MERPGGGLRRASDRPHPRWRIVPCDDRGRPDFRALHAAMRPWRPDVSRMAFFVFDMLFENGVDLRPLPLSKPHWDLTRSCSKARQAVPCLFLVEAFAEGEPLLEWCERYRLEGIVSKRLTSRYLSGPCRDWRKTKTDGWSEANQFRHKLFVSPRKRDPDPRSP